MGGLSLRTVARRVGATTGLLSHHSADRRDLIDAALDHAAGVMLGRILAVSDDVHPVELLAVVLPTDDATVEVWRFSLSVRTAGAVRRRLSASSTGEYVTTGRRTSRTV